MSAISPPRPCPICSARESDILHRQRFAHLPGALLDGYDVVVCRGCGFVFANGLPSADEFARYYTEASKYEHVRPAETERAADFAQWIAERVPATSRLLDVGCATGELLAELRQRGFHDLTGLDMSAASAKYARERHGLRVLHGPSVKDLLGTFDVIVLSSVLEHVLDLRGFLAQILAKLTPGGALAVEVPDAEHFLRSVNAPWQEFSTEHIAFFTAASLGNLLAVYGLRGLFIRHANCHPSPKLTSPVLSMIARQVDLAVMVPESVSERAVRAYVEDCCNRSDGEAGILRKLVRTQDPVLVWGVGTVTRRLLAAGLDAANIVAFADSDTHYQGTELLGHPVIAPEQIGDKFRGDILLGSWVFADEIAAQIRGMGLVNQVIRIDGRTNGN